MSYSRTRIRFFNIMFGTACRVFQIAGTEAARAPLVPEIRDFSEIQRLLGNFLSVGSSYKLDACCSNSMQNDKYCFSLPANCLQRSVYVTCFERMIWFGKVWCQAKILLLQERFTYARWFHCFWLHYLSEDHQVVPPFVNCNPRRLWTCTAPLFLSKGFFGHECKSCQSSSCSSGRIQPFCLSDAKVAGPPILAQSIICRV